MRIAAVTLALLISLGAGDALARGDIMPPPAPAPAVPVEREAMFVPLPTEPKVGFAQHAGLERPNASKTSPAKKADSKNDKVKPEPLEFEGKAKALDGERLVINENEIRLFGIVTPGVSSSFGPQARENLDKLLKGAVLCKVTDRDGDGRPIAFCGTVDTPDLSYEMLRQGWAMTDRKALKNNSLSGVYEKVEQEAKSLNKGLFAPVPMVTSIPLSNPANTVTVPLSDSAGYKVTPLPNTALSIIQPIAKPAAEPVKEPVKEKVAVAAPRRNDDKAGADNSQLILGVLLFMVGIGLCGGGVIARNVMQQKEKRKVLAAALSGELTAARHICRMRARELTRRRRVGESVAQPSLSQLWPRIRALVYQSHVGSIGLLGADLARRVAFIYGQCAEYGTYYEQTALQRLPTIQAASETLSLLADAIDRVLESLEYVERTGNIAPAVADDTALDDRGDSTMDIAQQVETAETRADMLRRSVDEEAKMVKARFEKMATDMVGMINQARDAAQEPTPEPADKKSDTGSSKAKKKAMQAG